MLQLFSASLLSVIGSFPTHLMPLLIAAVVVENRMSIANAGWLGSTFLIGQLIIVLTLPIFKINLISRRIAIIVCIIMLWGLFIVSLHSIEYILSGWFLIGLACGCLQFLGTTTAAQHEDKVFAFTFRLMIILFFTGVLIASMKFFTEKETYNSLILLLTFITFSLAIIALSIYKTSNEKLKFIKNNLNHKISISTDIKIDWFGLSMIFILFMAVYGYWIYLIHSTSSRGLPTENNVWIIAITKIIGAFFLLFMLTTSIGKKNKSTSLWLPSIFTSIGIASTALAASIEIWSIGLLFIELGFNALSARMQAVLMKRNFKNTGNWLTCSILVGSAFGSLVYGFLISYNIGIWLIIFTVFFVFVPAVFLQK
jgi:MFS family permease